MKLYWRMKKDGRWTWKAVSWTELERRIDPDTNTMAMHCIVYLEEDE